MEFSRTNYGGHYKEKVYSVDAKMYNSGMRKPEVDYPYEIAALLLKAGSWRFVRTTTCRAFSQNDMESIFQKMG